MANISNFKIAKEIYWGFHDFNRGLADLLDLCISNAPAVADKFLEDFLSEITPDEIREDFQTYPANYSADNDELESFISEMFEQTTHSFIFSKVTITADNDSYTEFLASGIPENEDDLTIYTDYQTLLEDDPDIQSVTVEVETYSYGDGESENADYELLEELANTDIEESDEYTLIQSHSFEIYDVHKEEN